MLRLSLILLLGVACGSAVQAQEAPAKACATTDAAFPAEFAGWAAHGPLHAASDASGLAGAGLTVGRAYDVELAATPKVSYPIQPEKPGGTVSHGGLVAVKIDRKGVYHVALSTPAWIDLVHAGKAQMSIAHGHGPDCTTIRKVVDFDLTPGDYVIQISANAGAQIALMVAPRP